MKLVQVADMKEGGSRDSGEQPKTPQPFEVSPPGKTYILS